MASENLTDKNVVFRKLKAKSENKICFDCSAKNPGIGYLWCVSLHRLLCCPSESWCSRQLRELRTMMFGGNNRAQVFFKQHGWTDGGKIEFKYTSRAADLYRQILVKEVAKAMAEETALPSSPVSASLPAEASNGFSSSVKVDDPSKESFSAKQDTPDVSSSPKASRTVVSNVVKKPLVAKKTGRTGGLGAQKLTTKRSENLYDQKPEEPAPVVTAASSANNSSSSSAAGPSFASRFGYVEEEMQTGGGQSGTQVLSHVAPPKSSNFFAEFEMENSFQKKSSSSSSKVEESDEARKKFSSAKSISSAQYFGEQSRAAGDHETRATLEKLSGSAAISSADLFGHGRDDSSSVDITASDLINRLSFQAQQDLSSLANIAGETKKKLGSLASDIFTDLQDRIL